MWEGWARERPRTRIPHPHPVRKTHHRTGAQHLHRAMGTARAVAPWAALLVLFASAVSFFVYQGWTTGRGPVLISDDVPSLSRFVESRVGHVLVPEKEKRVGCRYFLFSNDSGHIRDMGPAPCNDPPSQASPQQTGSAPIGDRLGAMRGAFKK